MSIEINTTYTTAKAKADAKNAVNDVIFAALVNEYGEDNVAYVRTETTTGGSNFIAVIAETLLVDGQEVPQVVGISASGKDPVDRETKTKVYAAFDFYGAKDRYEKWVEKKAADDAKKAAKKAEKKAIDADTSDF